MRVRTHTHTHTNNSLQTSLVHIRVAFQLIESFITFFMWLLFYKTVQIGDIYIQTYKKGNFEQNNIDAITVQ